MSPIVDAYKLYTTYYFHFPIVADTYRYMYVIHCPFAITCLIQYLIYFDLVYNKDHNFLFFRPEKPVEDEYEQFAKQMMGVRKRTAR